MNLKKKKKKKAFSVDCWLLHCWFYCFHILDRFVPEIINFYAIQLYEVSPELCPVSDLFESLTT